MIQTLRYLLFCVIHMPDALQAHISATIANQIPGSRAENTRRLVFLQHHFIIIQVNLQFIPNGNIQCAAQFNGQNNPAQFIYFSDNTGGLQCNPFLSSLNLSSDIKTIDIKHYTKTLPSVSRIILPGRQFFRIIFHRPLHRLSQEVFYGMMGWIWTGLIGISLAVSLFTGRGPQLSAATAQGAQNGITLAISLGGSICLWSGVGKLMERAGFTAALSRFLRPVLHRLFPSTKNDAALAGTISANLCANFLGLGNAATPMGIQAAKRLAAKGKPGVAGDELCRLVVLNTASIQLIPASVAALRVSLGCQTPYDILPSVWVSSAFSAGMGLLAAGFFRKLWRHD